MQAEPLAPITEDDIANYLVNTPDFFERHAEVLASVQLTSPHGNRAVSLQERQMEILREKIRALELKAAGMIRHGHDNVVIADKLHLWTRGLLHTRDAAALPEVLCRDMAEQFLVPQLALRLWEIDPALAGEPFAAPVAAALREQVSALPLPLCTVDMGSPLAQAVSPWLEQPQAVASMALIPLRVGLAPEAFGLLVLASGDAHRFTPDMGAEFLCRIGELAGAALSRLRPAA